MTEMKPEYAQIWYNTIQDLMADVKELRGPAMLNDFDYTRKPPDFDVLTMLLGYLRDAAFVLEREYNVN